MKKHIVIATFALAASACAGSNSKTDEAGAMASKAASQPAAKMGQDIVAVAMGAGSFNTLTTALKAAGLVDALKGDGPFTVFAPTDAAFAALPEGTLDNLLKPENVTQLQNILKYHVVPGKVMASQVTGLSEADTLLGQKLDISTADGKVMINDATVVQTDVAASNGVIHVVDKVILPPQ